MTLLCTGIAWLAGDSHTALSAALGGGISTVASLAMALLGFSRRSTRSPVLAVQAILVGEIAKIAVVIVLFAAVFKMLHVAPLAMFGAYIATFVVFPVALAGTLRDGAARPVMGQLKR